MPLEIETCLLSIILIIILFVCLEFLTYPAIFSELSRQKEKLPDENYLGNIETKDNYKIYDPISP